MKTKVQADLWLFYSTFVHSNTPNRIRFSAKVLEEFPQIFAHTEQNKCGEQTSDEQKRRLEQTLEMVKNRIKCKNLKALLKMGKSHFHTKLNL